MSAFVSIHFFLLPLRGSEKGQRLAAADSDHINAGFNDPSIFIPGKVL